MPDTTKRCRYKKKKQKIVKKIVKKHGTKFQEFVNRLWKFSRQQVQYYLFPIATACDACSSFMSACVREIKRQNRAKYYIYIYIYINIIYYTERERIAAGPASPAFFCSHFLPDLRKSFLTFVRITVSEYE